MNKTKNLSGALSMLDALREEVNKKKTVEDYAEEYEAAQQVKKTKSSPQKTNQKKKVSPTTVSAVSDTVVHLISPLLIRNWEFADRPESELGDINALAKEFLDIGQQQPCIIRPTHDPDSKEYELIVGERRWKAAEKANIDLKVIIQEMTDSEAAIIQAAENSSRKDLSDYARGMSYSKQIERGILERKLLTDLLGISKQQVSRLLSFSNIPKDITDAIQDMRQISARTASEICRLANKGELYSQAIIKRADKLRSGLLGQEKLYNQVIKEVETNEIELKKVLTNNIKISSQDGRHLFTWRMDNNNQPSVHFPQNITKLIENEQLSIDQLTKDFTDCILSRLNKLKTNID